MKTCRDCGKDKPLDSFSNDKNRSDGKYVYCKPCVKERSRERYLKKKDEINEKNKAWKEANKEHYLAQQREYSRKYVRSLNGKYVQYKGGAKKKDLEWNLTEKQFASFWQKDCHYCGDAIETIGIDRVDSSLGYKIENIISCCEVCNKIKLHHETEFLKAHLEKMLNRKELW